MNIRPRRVQREACAYLCRAEKDVYGVNEMNDMNPARQAFEDELRQLLIDSWKEKPIKVSQAADRLIELARRVINEE